MIPEVGHYALVLALALALIQAALPHWGARTNDMTLMSTAGSTALAQFIVAAASFAALTAAYVGSEVSVLNVFQNSHSAVALVYKFQPAPQGRQQVVTTLSSFVHIDSAVVRAIGRMGGSLVQKKADREARQLLRVFSKVSRAIEDNPADVYAKVRDHAGVPKQEVEEFRKLLRVP